MILKLHHAQITSAAESESLLRKFYLEELRLKELEKPPALKKNGGFWMELGDVQIHVGIEERSNRQITKSHLCFEVDNIQYWKDKMRSLNIEIIPGTGIPRCERFELRDPAGNRLEFLQRI